LVVTSWSVLPVMADFVAEESRRSRDVVVRLVAGATAVGDRDVFLGVVAPTSHVLGARRIESWRPI